MSQRSRGAAASPVPPGLDYSAVGGGTRDFAFGFRGDEKHWLPVTSEQGLDLTRWAGGIGSFAIMLDYSSADPRLLFQAIAAMNPVQYHWEVHEITQLARRGRAAGAEQERRQAAPLGEASSKGRVVGQMEAPGREPSTRCATSARHRAPARGLRTARGVLAHAGVGDHPHGSVALDVLSDATGGFSQKRSIP